MSKTTANNYLIDKDGVAYIVGLNTSSITFGKLGTNSTSNLTTFTKVDGMIPKGRVKKVEFGSYVTYFLTDDGKVYMTGESKNNEKGQMGEKFISSSEFVQMNIDKQVKDIQVDKNSVVILTTDGNVYYCGDSSNGKFGNKNEINTLTLLYDKGDAKSIELGSTATYILLNDRSLITIGTNLYGTMGLGDEAVDEFYSTFETLPINNVDVVRSCNARTFVLKKDGTLWACGRNNNGILGVSDTVDRTSFVRVPFDKAIKNIYINNNAIYVLGEDGNIYASGDIKYGILTSSNRLTSLSGFSDIVSISVETAGIHALNEYGDIYTYGINSSGQLGNGTSSDLKSSMKITSLVGLDLVPWIDDMASSSDVLSYPVGLYSGLDSTGKPKMIASNINPVFSTEEIFTGMYWIDNKPIFSKVVKFGGLPNSTSKSLNHNISGIVDIIDYSGVAKKSGIHKNISNLIEIDSTNIVITTEVDMTEYENSTIVIKYTK